MKNYRRLTTSLLLLSLFASLFVPFQRAARAQVNTCPGNLITNGNFTNGLVSGAMPSPGAAANWSVAYGTPDVGTGMGWNDNGFVSMWGNQSIGEGLQQTGLSLVGGTTYVISFGARVNYVPGANQSYARFRLRASNSTVPTQSSGALTVGLSNIIQSTSGWTPVSFTWTAPSSFNRITLSVENNFTASNGVLTSSGSFDNFCIREVPPDFEALRLCQGKTTIFNATAPGGVTSWNWDFGDGGIGTGQQTTHTYNTAGTYNVKLCVNGSTNCVTKPVTINVVPTPVIYGPTNACDGLNATYSVAAASGVTYSWSVTGGTITGPATGASVNVTWNSSGGGSVTVVGTDKTNCSASATVKVSDCKVWLDKCCDAMKLSATAPQAVPVGGNIFTLTPTLTTPNSITRVAANIISTERTFSSASCGTNGPFSAHVVNAMPVAGFVPSLPVAFSHEAIWHTSGAGVNLGGGLAFPLQIQFPPPPSGKSCTDTLKICVKYTFTTEDCRSCEIIRCYNIPRKKIIIWDHAVDVGVFTAGTVFSVTVELDAPEGGGGQPKLLNIGIKPGTGPRGAQLRGPTTAEVVDGMATFKGLSINEVGEGYVLTVSGRGLREPMETDPFSMVQVPRRR